MRILCLNLFNRLIPIYCRERTIKGTCPRSP
nr:MAG TPA: hypothetical protein [Inoviridae sp.]